MHLGDLLRIGALELLDGPVALILGLLVELGAVLVEDLLRWPRGRQEADVVDLGPSSLADDSGRARDYASAEMA